jgi:hypothetical protein
MPHPAAARASSLTPVVSLWLFAALAGCSDPPPAPGNSGLGLPGLNAGAGGNDGGISLGSGNGTSISGNADAGLTPATGAGGATASANAYPCLQGQGKEASCAGQLYEGQGLPLDIHVMFDQSGSMALKDDGAKMRIDAVRGAVGQFLEAPASQGMGVGIGYFGFQPLACGCTSCDAADYAKPAVNMGLLPTHAAAIMGSLNKIEPVGETPTGAAIRGACSYAKARKAADPGRNVVILLVTDGEPKAPLSASKGGCNPTLEDAVAAAAECTAAGVKTYVLGVGPSLQNLNQIAQSGGTKQAYLAATGGGEEVLKALNSIRSDAMIPCTLQLPKTAGTVDPQKVNLLYSSNTCSSVATFLNVKDAGGCDAQKGGWYYEDPAHPGSIQLCKASCDAVKAPGGQLMVSVGCVTQVVD